jgi:hypothetical protein
MEVIVLGNGNGVREQEANSFLRTIALPKWSNLWMNNCRVYRALLASSMALSTVVLLIFALRQRGKKII